MTYKDNALKLKEKIYMSRDRIKKVYVCKLCNTYMTRDSDESAPLCCGRSMIVMDELSEDEIYEEKESSGGR